MLGGGAALWLYTNKVLAPVQIGTPPPDFPFQLAGYTDIPPEAFVYAKTPEGHWIAAAADPEGRMFMIDEIGDLYYDSGRPELGVYAVRPGLYYDSGRLRMDTRGNLFNFYQDVDGSRRITPVGNVSQLRRFKINEIAGIKLDRDVTVVAFEDGTSVPLPPGAGRVDKDGKFIPPGELVEGIVEEAPASPFAKLLGGNREYPLTRYEVDLNDPRPFDRQLFDQTLLDDPDIPGFQPALPKDFSLDQLADEVRQEQRSRR